MRSLILSQWRDLRIGVTREDLGALTTVRASTECGNCRSQFTHENYKVRHHDHTTGEFLFTCCRHCNLQLKPKKCRGYQLPVIAHNSVGYDLHYIIKHYKKRYDDDGGESSSDDVTIIPLNGERFYRLRLVT